MNKVRRSKKCLRCFVSGRVQGVYFRGSTQNEASKLGLVGYAKNLPDGRVEVLAFGNEESVAALQAWLWQGPSYAQVNDVQCETIDRVNCPQEFTTG